MNKVILMGNLTREVELRYSQNGNIAIGKTAIALNRRTQNGDEVTFIDCTLFGKTAEVAHQYLSKGSKVLFEGRLNLEQWQDQQTGQNRQKLAVIVENLEFVGSGNNQQQNKQPQQPQVQQQNYQQNTQKQQPQVQQQPLHYTTSQEPSSFEMSDDGIPF